jgi:hypothetical protein
MADHALVVNFKLQLRSLSAAKAGVMQKATSMAAAKRVFVFMIDSLEV